MMVSLGSSMQNPSIMPWNILWITFVLLATVLNVNAQSSNVTQCIPSYQWSVNSLGQTPCLVAAYLESQCSDAPFAVDSIPVNNHYLPPTFAVASPCMCSSVTYSMISACGGCQNRTFTTWTNWTMNCPTIELIVFPKPIPASTVVPTWAYLNVTLTNNNFDALVAQSSLLQTTTSSSSASSSSASSSTSSSSTTLPATSALVTQTNAASSSHSNAGAIAGGVVGGLVLVAIIALLVFWFIIRGRKQRAKDFDDGRSSAPPLMQQTPTLRDGPSPMSTGQTPYLYGSDTSTYPISPTTSGFYTTGPTSRKSLETESQFGSQAPRGYTGAAEI